MDGCQKSCYLLGEELLIMECHELRSLYVCLLWGWWGWCVREMSGCRDEQFRRVCITDAGEEVVVKSHL